MSAKTADIELLLMRILDDLEDFAEICSLMVKMQVRTLGLTMILHLLNLVNLVLMDWGEYRVDKVGKSSWKIDVVLVAGRVPDRTGILEDRSDDGLVECHN